MDRQPTSRNDHGARIARTIRYIDANLSADLSLDTLAGVAALSRFHFSRVFRGLTGEGVAETVRRRRLNRAALLVASTVDTMDEIAAKTGFGHPGSFERAFTVAYGMTPKQARSAGRIQPPLLPPEKGDYTMFPTEIRDGEEVILAALPHKGAYHEIGKVFEKLASGLMERNLWKGSGPSFGIYYDDPSETPVEELRSHAGQRLAAGSQIPDGFDRVVLAGGKFLVLTSKGPYSKLPEAWAFLYARALPEGGHQFREGLPYERYVSNAWDTKPEDLITEIWVPVV